MSDTMLEEATAKITSRGFSFVRAVSDKLQNRGFTHTILERDDEVFSLRAKEYRYENKASFGLEQVEEAVEENHQLLSYIQQEDTFYVFDAAFILSEGSTYEQPSKKSDARTWIEVSAKCGATLSKYPHEQPESLAGENNTLAAY